jgi:hypothetical protein
MEYAASRADIKTGDLIAVRNTTGLRNRIVQFFTRGPYTHCGLAIWIGGRLYMTELNDGFNHLVPLSQLDDVAFDVYAHPPELSTEALEASIMSWLASKVDYGYTAFFAIGLLNWLRVKTFVHWRRILVCSGYCVANWERAGWAEHSRIVSPVDLAAEVVLKFSVTPSVPQVDLGGALGGA